MPDGAVGYTVLPQTVAGDEGMSKALMMLSLLDWKRVVNSPASREAIRVVRWRWRQFAGASQEEAEVRVCRAAAIERQARAVSM
jgi:hypothetical protein